MLHMHFNWHNALKNLTGMRIQHFSESLQYFFLKILKHLNKNDSTFSKCRHNCRCWGLATSWMLSSCCCFYLFFTHYMFGNSKRDPNVLISYRRKKYDNQFHFLNFIIMYRHIAQYIRNWYLYMYDFNYILYPA